MGGSERCTVHLIVVWLSWCHYVWTWGLHRQGKCIERLAGLFVATWKVPRRGFLGTENLTEPCLCWHNLLGQVRLEQGWLWPCHVYQSGADLFHSERPCKEKPEVSQQKCSFVSAGDLE